MILVITWKVPRKDRRDNEDQGLGANGHHLDDCRMVGTVLCCANDTVEQHKTLSILTLMTLTQHGNLHTLGTTALVHPTYKYTRRIYHIPYPKQGTNRSRHKDIKISRTDHDTNTSAQPRGFCHSIQLSHPWWFMGFWQKPRHRRALPSCFAIDMSRDSPLHKHFGAIPGFPSHPPPAHALRPPSAWF